MPTALSTLIEADRSATTRIVVERAGERHRIFARPGLIRAQTIRNDARSCRIGLLATSALLLGGDRVLIEVEVGPGATVELFDVAGTVAYHGRGRACGLAHHGPGRPRRDAALGRRAVRGGRRCRRAPHARAGAGRLRHPAAARDAGARPVRRGRWPAAHPDRDPGRRRTGAAGGPVAGSGRPPRLPGPARRPPGDRQRACGRRFGCRPPPPGAVRFGLVGGRGSLTRYLGSELAGARRCHRLAATSS